MTLKSYCSTVTSQNSTIYLISTAIITTTFTTMRLSQIQLSCLVTIASAMTHNPRGTSGPNACNKACLSIYVCASICGE